MQRKTENERRPGGAAVVTAVLCVLVGVGGQVVFAAFVIGLGLDLLPERAALPAPWPWAVNLGWLALFAVQHSGMARTGFKRRWAQGLSPRLERAVYVALSGLLLVGISLTWQPLPGEPLWRLPAWFVAVSAAGFVGTGIVLKGHDQPRFFGLRQALRRESPGPEPLRVTGPYRYVRHPLMTCTLLFLWGLPVMSPALALLSGGLTVYILLAILLEERDLQREYGAAYEEYRRRVPALFPWRPPLPQESRPAKAP